MLNEAFPQFYSFAVSLFQSCTRRTCTLYLSVSKPTYIDGFAVNFLHVLRRAVNIFFFILGVWVKMGNDTSTSWHQEIKVKVKMIYTTDFNVGLLKPGWGPTHWPTEQARSMEPRLIWWKKDGFKVSFWPVLQHSLNPSVTLLNWVKTNNAVRTPMPIHRLCTDISPYQRKKTHFWGSNLRHLRLILAACVLLFLAS